MQISKDYKTMSYFKLLISNTMVVLLINLLLTSDTRIPVDIRTVQYEAGRCGGVISTSGS